MESKKPHRKNCACLFCKQARAGTQETGLVPARNLPAPIPQEEVVEVDGEFIPVITSLPTSITARDRVIQWLTIRAQNPDLTVREIAEEIGIGTRSLHKYIQQATEKGWLRFSNPMDVLEHRIIPKATDNLIKFLEDGDKQVTIEVARGTLFKTYQESQGINRAPQTVLSLRIESVPTEGMDIGIIEGKILGKPKLIQETTQVDKDKVV